MGVLAALCSLAIVCTTGCQMIGYGLYSVLPEPTEKIPAEFNRLDGKKAAVLVWAPSETMLQFPHVRLELASQTAYQMKQRLKTTTVVPPEQVAAHQDRNLNWDAVPPSEIGKQFGADYVIFIELLEYSTRDPKMPGLFRGRARVSIVVHDVNDPTARWSLTPAVAEYPTGHTRLPNADDMIIHRQMLEILGSQITSKFYDHEIPRDKNSRGQGAGDRG
jgi:hypothetical protein